MIMVVFWLDAGWLESGGDFSVDCEVKLRLWMGGVGWRGRCRFNREVLFIRFFCEMLVASLVAVVRCWLGSGPLMGEVSGMRPVEGLVGG